jgi:hypothetical protein
VAYIIISGTKLDGYPRQSPIRRIRPSPLTSTLVYANSNFKQPHAMRLHKPQFRLVLDIRLAKHQMRMPLGRHLARQVKQPHKFTRGFDWRFAYDRRQFVYDTGEHARWCQHAEPCDAQRAVRMFSV